MGTNKDVGVAIFFAIKRIGFDFCSSEIRGNQIFFRPSENSFFLFLLDFF